MHLPVMRTEYMLNTGCLLNRGGHKDRFTVLCNFMAISIRSWRN